MNPLISLKAYFIQILVVLYWKTYRVASLPLALSETEVQVHSADLMGPSHLPTE